MKAAAKCNAFFDARKEVIDGVGCGETLLLLLLLLLLC